MNEKFTHSNLSHYWGEDPTLDRIISLLGETEDVGDGNDSVVIGDGDIGLNITRDCVEVCDLTGDSTEEIGSILLLNKEDHQFLRQIVKAYLITNQEVLEPTMVKQIKELLAYKI